MSRVSEYVLPAMRGVQAGKHIFVSLCPLHLASKIFHFAEAQVPEHLRRTRALNMDTVLKIAKYLGNNPSNYVLPALFVSLDGDHRFEPLEVDSELGHLRVSMVARLVINGGEHERAAIEKALMKQPTLSYEKIVVVFLPDRKLKRAARIYAELKSFTARPSASLRLLHSTDDELVRLTRELVDTAVPFERLVELKRSALAPRSRMLFTLSAVHQANKALLIGTHEQPYEERLRTATQFWNAVDAQIAEWRLVRAGKMHSSDLRTRFIHSHGLALQALGKAGNALLGEVPDGWKSRLKKLRQLDWRRANTNLWEGRALIGGRVSKSVVNVVLTGNVIKHALDLPLLSREDQIEQAHLSGLAKK